jgi:DNA polymerase elongation subunit (family B)
MGEQLSRVTFDDVSSFAEFAKNYAEATKVFGQTSAVHQWLAKEFPGQLHVDMSAFKVLNFDIEVEHSEGFPKPEDANYEVLSISMKVFGKPKKITLGLKPYTPKHENQLYVQCADEKELLVKFLGFWRQIDPDIITGWNIEGFDVPYLVNRITKILGEEIAKQLSPFYKDTKRVFTERWVGRDDDELTYEILGIQTYDYLNLYKKFALKKLESYKLDFVGSKEKVGQKVDLTPWGNNLMRLYHEDYDTFIEYNERDVELVEKIDGRCKFIQVAISIAYMTHSRLSEALATVKPWDNYFYNLLLDEGMTVPPSGFAKETEKIVGAYVKEPDPGLYEWVVSFDLTSLYPSIMQLLNMGPESQEHKALDIGTTALKWVEKILNEDPEFLAVLRARAAEGLATAANGASFRQDKEAILARGARFAFEERKTVKKEMIAQKKRKEAGTEGLDNEIARLDANQGALKVLGNGLYGASANGAFRYYSREIAEGITLTGQLIIQFISRKINALLNEKFKTEGVEYTFYNDTDSCYITFKHFVRDILKISKDKQEGKELQITEIIDQFCKKEIDPLLDREFTWLAGILGSKNNTLSMKREAIAESGLFRKRKNYVLLVWDMEGVRNKEAEVKAVGVEMAKSSTPQICRDELEKMMPILLKKDNNTLLSAIAEFKKKFYNCKPSEIGRPIGVSEIKGKTFQTKKNPIHVRASLGFNEMVKEHKLNGVYELVKDGTKIKYVFLKMPNHLHQNVIGFTDDLPTEFNLHKYIDFETQFSKTYLEPLRSFTDLIGWDVEKRSTLDDLWE